MWLNSMGIPAVVPLGLVPFIPILPNPAAEMHIWVSKPMKLPKIENPTPEDVNKYHAEYVELLSDLHARRKRDSDPKLEIW